MTVVTNGNSNTLNLLFEVNSLDFFDLHCDTPTECYNKNKAFIHNDLAVSNEKGSVFDNWHQCFAIWIDDKLYNPYVYYKNVLNDFKIKLKGAKNNLTPLFMVEGGSLIENEAERVIKLKKDGIKALTLTWDGENQIASGSRASGGLKPFGRRVIELLNECKIATDLSHLNRKSFFDVIEISNCPIATHSCCDGVYSHRRNLTDEQIKLIVERNGIIGLCLCPLFLGKGDVFMKIYKHLYHLLDKGYENHIAIGSDFDGAEMNEHLTDISKIPLLYDKLIDFGIEESVLQKIFFKNAYNFFLKL